jgi:VanZ family protein
MVAVFGSSLHAMSTIVSLLVLDPRLRSWRYRCALILYGAILLVGSVPGARSEIGQVASGIVLHSLAYASLTFLLWTGSGGSATERAVKAVLSAAAMGALDELVQSFLPYRSGSFSDWAVDVGAALLTATALWILLRKRLHAA